MKIAAWRTNGAFEAVGATDDEIDEIAESQVDELIAVVPRITSPLPIDQPPTFVLADCSVEPLSFSPGRAVAGGPPARWRS